MYLAGNTSLQLNYSLELDQDSCNKLHIFFKDTVKDVIAVSDTVVCAMNVLFSFIAVFANIIILYALCKASSLHSPSKALLCSLALSDLGVGAIVQPLFVAYRWAHINDNLPELCTAGIISHIEGSHFSAVSFLTMTAISLDRFLALLLRVRYHSVVTLKRVLAVLLVIWVLSGVWASLWAINQRIYSFISILLIPICFLIALFSYIKIYFCLRRQTILMRRHAHASTSVETLNGGGGTPSQIRYRKSVISMFYLFCAFLLSYLPYLSHKILVGILGWRTSMSVLFSFGLTLVYVNSSLNPLIYCWRITEIKQLVISILCATKTAIWSAGNIVTPATPNEKQS
ncbi:hypothetical protein OS493_003080 [Desmophyllum pertusum]|uniref:G-protein coupled receptors family 1 profile domain-containing protein n=1 Tax=Desmophyllum pertusum TaxID=174260 RepID=A0A9X0CH38_9CNID|nr:hypothetical protein OS493_003080 [Desmophyllum pertusum]